MAVTVTAATRWHGCYGFRLNAGGKSETAATAIVAAAASRRRHRRRQRIRWRRACEEARIAQDDGRSQRKKEEGRAAWRERRETGAFGAQGWRRVRSRIRYLARDNHLNERIELLERPATPAHPHAEAREGGGRTCEKRARHALAWRWLSDGSGERLAGVGLRERIPGDGVVQPRPSTPIVDHDVRRRRQQQTRL